MAVAESCLRATDRAVGATVALPPGRRPDAVLFGEAAGRVVVAAAAGADEIAAAAAAAGVPCSRIGATDASGRLRIGDTEGNGWVDLPIVDLRGAHGNALSKVLE